jgi:hypothetical protein
MRTREALRRTCEDSLAFVLILALALSVCFVTRACHEPSVFSLGEVTESVTPGSSR